MHRQERDITETLAEWLEARKKYKEAANQSIDNGKVIKPELPIWAIPSFKLSFPPSSRSVVMTHSSIRQLQTQNEAHGGQGLIDQENISAQDTGMFKPVSSSTSSTGPKTDTDQVEGSKATASDRLNDPTSALTAQLERLNFDGPQDAQADILHMTPPSSSGLPSARLRRSLQKLEQPWRRTNPGVPLRRNIISSSSSVPQSSFSSDAPAAAAAAAHKMKDMHDTLMTTSTGAVDNDFSNIRDSSETSDIHTTDGKKTLYLPHDILLAIFSHLQSRANAQQYYDLLQPSDLLSCSRVNMAWRIAALSTIWQTIVLPDPFDRSCRRLLLLLASSHASAQITGKNYDITEIIQRVEIDLLEATELGDPSTMQSMASNVETLLKYISPFRTLSIQLPQEIEFKAAEIMAGQTSRPILNAITSGVAHAQVRELDMPSPMYCSVPTFPGMLNLISSLKTLRVLILGYSSRDWPLLRAIISLPLLESLCVFDSCWSNQIWIYLLSSLGPRLRGLTVLQGRRPLQGVVVREGIAPFCPSLTSLSIPFIQLLSGPGPVLTNDDIIPVLKACHNLQNINVAGQRLLGDPVLEATADLWGLQTLDIRECPLMTGQTIKSVRWQSIQRVRMFGCGEISQEFMDLVLRAWRNGKQFGPHGYSHQQQHQHYQGHRPSLKAPFPSSPGMNASTSSSTSSSSSTSATVGMGALPMVSRFASVLDFQGDVEDPVEMGWVRQREDEPPLDLDEDHFFADWYC
ncbi:hypothetical protein BGZ94_002990 [Podila epigama]|nr:hypothetical protein BGZ94_002990 [Podila epigama]